MQYWFFAQEFPDKLIAISGTATKTEDININKDKRHINTKYITQFGP